MSGYLCPGEWDVLMGDQMDSEILFCADPEYMLRGALSIPDGFAEPYPAAVIVHAYGSFDMDGTIGRNKPYRDIAEALVKKGIAVFRYTKRTYLYVSVMNKICGTSAKEETIDDAVSAVGLLKDHPKIDSKRVFLIGHDFGGMLAPRIDAEGADCRGMVIMAGSPRPLEDVFSDQIARTVKSQRGLLKLLAMREADSMKKRLKALPAVEEEDSKYMTAFGRSTAWFFKEMSRNPIPEYLLESDKAMLIMQGDADFQVSVQEDFEEYRDILAGKDHVTFRLYPGLNHFFMKSVSGDIRKYKKEYRTPGHVDTGVLEDIADWILNGA
jgi:dienelactone hydrolase